MDNVNQKSLELHKSHGGKLSLASKVPLENKDDLSLAYTPGVAEVSRIIGQDKTLAKTYTLKKNTIAVLSDGSAILGLGNLGPEAAIPVMEGKAVLFKKFADLDAFPICLATQDTEEIIRTAKLIAPVFGGINLEDISAPRCFEVERHLQAELDIPVMHDDQHGTAVVVLAGLINALKIKKTGPQNTRVVMSGAGAAGNAVFKLLRRYGFQDIVVCDRQGAIHAGRTDLNSEKLELAQNSNPRNIQGSLAGTIRQSDIFIGVSQGGIVNEEMICSMNPEPIIFALANPTPEIMPDLAKNGGALIVATGRSDFPNQVNNVLAFPGIFRGALDHQIRQFTDDMFLAAAKKLAELVPNPTPDKILPSPFEPGISEAVSEAIR